MRARGAGRIGRLMVVTGARQTGKTTLVQAAFPDYTYISVEDPAVRPAYTALSAADWIERYPRAIVDEVQKAPSIVESLKAAYDQSRTARYILLGSSQILLLSKVKESLAGRVSITELWPLTLPEIATASWEEPVVDSRLVAWLRSKRRGDAMLLGIPQASRAHARHAVLFERYLRFGGMPVVHDPELTDEDRVRWLRDYQRTYLERDVADLATMRDLEPFVLAERAIAAHSGKLVNWSDLARTVSVAPATAKRFMRYLELSYQVILLRPYFRNEDKRLAKMPKVHFLDPGILRTVLNRQGDPTGDEYESAVIAEIVKQVRSAEIRADFHHLRTHDGREVDLLVELDNGFVAVEVKLAGRVSDKDARHLRGLGDLLDKPLLGRFVLSSDPHPRHLADGVLALPASWALAPAAAPASTRTQIDPTR